jgi:hypothetical protein
VGGTDESGVMAVSLFLRKGSELALCETAQG